MSVSFRKVVWTYDTTGDGVMDTIGVDTTGDGEANFYGEARDTTGDGKVDAVAVDSNLDGCIDMYLAVDGLDNSLKVNVREKMGSGGLLVTFPEREKLTLDLLMDAIDAWGDHNVQDRGERVTFQNECEFECLSATFRGPGEGEEINLIPHPMGIDTSGDGHYDCETNAWALPVGYQSIGDLLKGSNDEFDIVFHETMTRADQGSSSSSPPTKLGSFGMATLAEGGNEETVNDLIMVPFAARQLMATMTQEQAKQYRATMKAHQIGIQQIKAKEREQLKLMTPPAEHRGIRGSQDLEPGESLHKSAKKNKSGEAAEDPDRPNKGKKTLAQEAFLEAAQKKDLAEQYAAAGRVAKRGFAVASQLGSRSRQITTRRGRTTPHRLQTVARSLREES